MTTPSPAQLEAARKRLGEFFACSNELHRRLCLLLDTLETLSDEWDREGLEGFKAALIDAVKMALDEPCHAGRLPTSDLLPDWAAERLRSQGLLGEGTIPKPDQMPGAQKP